MKVTFWGAAQVVTGSMHLLETNGGKKIVLDCGLFQGHQHGFEDLNATWPCNPAEIDYVILSHAHVDHCGMLPRLVRDGYKGPIFCTPATHDLAAIMLADSAHIQEKDAENTNKRKARKGEPLVTPLYKLDDVPGCLNAFIGIGYERWFSLNEEVSFIFKDAGHILGSASVSLKIKEGDKTFMLGFTGDIGRPGIPIIKDPVPPEALDYLISESTYGGRFHEQGPEASENLLEVVKDTCIKRRGKLIIPSFSVGRTQELVYALDKLKQQGLLPHIPIYVDSPLAVNATEIFSLHPECFDSEMMRYIQKDADPFGFNHVHYVRDVEESKSLNSHPEPCIIISASGMIEAGRIKHHIRNHIEDPACTVLIVGYCTPYTLGGKLREGADKITIFGEEYAVRAKVVIMDAYSSHGDQKEMLDFLRLQQTDKLKQIFLVHGEIEGQELYKSALLAKGFKQIEIPQRGDSFVIG